MAIIRVGGGGSYIGDDGGVVSSSEDGPRERLVIGCVGAAGSVGVFGWASDAVVADVLGSAGRQSREQSLKDRVCRHEGLVGVFSWCAYKAPCRGSGRYIPWVLHSLACGIWHGAEASYGHS